MSNVYWNFSSLTCLISFFHEAFSNEGGKVLSQRWIKQNNDDDQNNNNSYSVLLFGTVWNSQPFEIRTNRNKWIQPSISQLIGNRNAFFLSFFFLFFFLLVLTLLQFRSFVPYGPCPFPNLECEFNSLLFIALSGARQMVRIWFYIRDGEEEERVE